ncbi:DNA starvation/stationary phase protection protein [Fluoribacter dumoffii]|uniref:DNA protection during starvation protein 2 n=1 Tax=Fluoribacter dumoffii TaxID=463 RepID=A0A377GCH0_9GAMM|nr:DNA starvation/stationary phase protection protein [Fluoribacter dumoffii]KTC90702.1 ferritin [Fluoribacter dumoffii NY 23]MCW8386382.1 DNA starvation/stationary phase protection protein [Fluoribacter dumoffii]MCW8419435.1 DNA starvation/stationary phase protection protein [Fluoribacter dumoffii]MCW8452690.1 DNA starvation/stationary phase protection protein [Fluoribacter dumoffii]MCW8460060.1 DNA starvation/stationary phase protection protein [Fluoribacter dumoffii]
MKKLELYKLETPNDLDIKARHKIAEALNPLVADTFALFVKTKNFHWHMTGPHYRDYHLLLDEHSEQIFAMIDVLAERVRKLGERTIHSIGQIKQLQTLRDANETLSADDMLKALLEDNKAFLKNLRKAHEVCSNKNDFATTSVLEVYIDETERRIWFLFETLQNK